MYNRHGVQAYRETNIASMTREKMIVLLYEKIVSDLGEARLAIVQGDRVRMTQSANHSQRIVSELRNALDHSLGGEISRNLEALYDYLFHQHLELLLDQDPARIDNCLRVIAPLLEAWRQVPVGTGEQAARDRARGVSADPAGPNRASPPKIDPAADSARRDLVAQQAAAATASGAGAGRTAENSELLSVSA